MFSCVGSVLVGLSSFCLWPAQCVRFVLCEVAITNLSFTQLNELNLVLSAACKLNEQMAEGFKKILAFFMKHVTSLQNWLCLCSTCRITNQTYQRAKLNILIISIWSLCFCCFASSGASDPLEAAVEPFCSDLVLPDFPPHLFLGWSDSVWSVGWRFTRSLLLCRKPQRHRPKLCSFHVCGLVVSVRCDSE